MLSLLLLSRIAAADDVLLVGASYVTRNDLSVTLEALLDAGSGADRSVSTLAAGGYSWSRHAADASTAGTARTTLYDTAWSAALMQEFTDVAATDRSSSEWRTSLAAGTELVTALEANGADVFLYMTWGDREGSSEHPDFPTMQSALEDAYAEYRDTMRADGLQPYIAPAGVAWRLVYEASADPLAASSLFTRLYASDGQHPSPAGSYLTACTMYASLTGLSSVGLPTSAGVTAEQAAILQEFADAAVFGAEGAAYDFPWSSSSGGGDTGTPDDTGTDDTGSGGDSGTGGDSGGADTAPEDSAAPDDEGDSADTAADDGPPVDDAPKEDAGGCGCASGGVRGAPALAALLSMAALVRRRNGAGVRAVVRR
jgi:MYXO-CTERM domain-containing protein